MQNEYNTKAVFEEIEQELITKMKRTLWSHKEDEKAEHFNWPQWQAIKLKQFQEYKEANKEIFNEKTKPFNRHVYKHIKDQFREGASRTNKEAIKAGIIKKEDAQLGGSFFGLNHRKLDALIKSTKDDMKDVKYATLRMANDQYRQIIYKAQVYANTGAGTVKQAIDMATKDFLARGFNCIEYKNGSRHNIADYCEMAITTANKRANLMGEGEMMKELGVTTTYVSKHGTACGKCAKWEGRVYIDDVWAGGKAEDGKYPLLSTAIAGGLFHPKCRHGRTVYYEGINDEPKEVTEAKHNHNKDDEYTQELQRRQQQYERLALGSLFPGNVLYYQNKANELQNQIESGKIIKNVEKEEMELHDIGNINKDIIGEYGDKIITDKVIITYERIEHIKEHHPDLKDKEIQFIKKVLNDPDIIFEDRKNKDTILMVKNILDNDKNYRMVLKLSTNINLKDKSNSIISFWNISNKKLRQYERNEKIIYKKLDKKE